MPMTCSWSRDILHRGSCACSLSSSWHSAHSKISVARRLCSLHPSRYRSICLMMCACSGHSHANTYTTSLRTSLFTPKNCPQCFALLQTKLPGVIFPTTCSHQSTRSIHPTQYTRIATPCTHIYCVV